MFTFIVLGSVIAFVFLTYIVAKAYRNRVGRNFLVNGTSGMWILFVIASLAGLHTSGLLEVGAVCDPDSLQWWIFEGYYCAAPRLVVFEGSDLGAGLFNSGLLVALLSYLLNLSKGGVVWGTTQSFFQLIFALLFSLIMIPVLILRFSGNSQRDPSG